MACRRRRTALAALPLPAASDAQRWASSSQHTDHASAPWGFERKWAQYKAERSGYVRDTTHRRTRGACRRHRRIPVRRASV